MQSAALTRSASLPLHSPRARFDPICLPAFSPSTSTTHFACSSSSFARRSWSFSASSSTSTTITTNFGYSSSSFTRGSLSLSASSSSSQPSLRKSLASTDPDASRFEAWATPLLESAAALSVSLFKILKLGFAALISLWYFFNIYNNQEDLFRVSVSAFQFDVEKFPKSLWGLNDFKGPKIKLARSVLLTIWHLFVNMSLRNVSVSFTHRKKRRFPFPWSSLLPMARCSSDSVNSQMNFSAWEFYVYRCLVGWFLGRTLISLLMNAIKQSDSAERGPI